MAAELGAWVAARRPRWRELEVLLDALDRRRLSLSEIESLTLLHREAAGDLARAQRDFTGTDVARHLNQLCARSHGRLQPKRRFEWATVRRFYGYELPAVVRAEWRPIAVSAVLLTLGVVLGATTVAMDPRGAELLVPPELREIVARGELWTDTIEGQQASSAIASQILTNNLQVTFQVFAFGLTAGVLTVFALVWNGVHIGALIAHCAHAGLAPGLLGFMAAHGPLELSMIAIAGGAGLMIAQALVLPGERPRGEALRERGGRAVRLVVGLAPLLALTGVIEGFVSPGRLFPVAAKVVVGVGLGVGFWLWLWRSGRTGEPGLRRRA